MATAHRFDQTLMFIPLEAAAPLNRDRLAAVLSRLSAEDPAIVYSSDLALNLFLLHGTSEAELDKQVTTLRAACPFDLRYSSPQVAYIEKPMKRAEIDYTLRTIVNPRFARLKLILQPTAVDRPVSFDCRVSEVSMPLAFVQAVERGIGLAARCGILAGFPVRGVDATLIQFAGDDTSTAEAFEEAACAAFRQSLRNVGSILFEPLMKVVITIPETYEGSVAGDMLGRRGRIVDRTTDGTVLTMTATVPLANMFGYGNQLRSFTQGRGTFAMQFDRYEQMPAPSSDPPFRPAAALRVA